jgi:hypothetical protein
MNKRRTINTKTNTNPSPVLPPRGLRVQAAASYSGLSPFFIEELIRNGTLPAVGGPGTGIAAYVVLREHLDEYLDELGEHAVERAEKRRKAQSGLCLRYQTATILK